jgi:class 3 adenylate cyclase
MADALSAHDDLLRSIFESQSGHVFKTVGDAFCVAFDRCDDAVRAATMAQQALATQVWPVGLGLSVRMALHAGECTERDGDYFGPAVNRVARLEAIAHGGQVVLSQRVVDMLDGWLPDDVVLRDMGEHRLKDLTARVTSFRRCARWQMLRYITIFLAMRRALSGVLRKSMHCWSALLTGHW